MSHGGKNDMFAAWADSGGLVMGYYDGSDLPLTGWPGVTPWPTISSLALSAARFSTTCI
jgi:hypothetical protein